MSATPYKIHRICRRTKIGSTAASFCTLSAVLKFDSDESPFCVYNEHVATKLAQTLHLPAADGVLTSTGDGPTYASLEVFTPGLSLPDLLQSQCSKAAAVYPNEVAALVAFDILIGNNDRGENLKACLATPHIRIFKAFDHGNCLLNIEGEPHEKCLRMLESGDLIVKHHPFYGLVRESLLNDWTKRISEVGDLYFDECCNMGKTFRAVTVDMQKATASALIARKKALPGIIAKHLAVINPCLL